MSKDKHDRMPHDEMAAEVREAMQALDRTCSVLQQAGMGKDVVGSALLNLLFVHASRENGRDRYDPCSDHEIVQAALAFSHARLHKFLGSDK